jgi:hypothetical protein
MSDNPLDEVLRETWEVETGDLMTVYVVGGDPDDWATQVCVCTHTPEENSRQLARARAAVASQAPELYRALAAIVEAWDIPDTGWDIVTWPIEDARKILAAVREAAGE